MLDDTSGAPASTSPSAPLRVRTLKALGLAGLALAAGLTYAATVSTLGMVSAIISVAIYAAVCGVVITHILSYHPYRVFGWPNAVTLARTVLTALIAGYTAEISLWTLAPSQHLAWTFAILASIAVALDGVDGWLARRIGPRSDFGARFDMESDALLILILSVLAVILGKVGLWAVAIGAMRYLFVGAAWLWLWIDRPLPLSARRKIVCVVQCTTLCLIAMPPIDGWMAEALAGIALTSLALSFAIDLLWLHRRRLNVDPA